MTLAQTVLSQGLVRLTELLPTTFIVGEDTFTGLLSEAKVSQPAGGKAVQAGEVFFNEIQIKPTEEAFTNGSLKDGATITSNGQKFTVVGKPRSYGQHIVKITVRQVK